MKRIYETFEDKEFEQLEKAKEKKRKELKKDKLSWHDYFLIIANGK